LHNLQKLAQNDDFGCFDMQTRYSPPPQNHERRIGFVDLHHCCDYPQDKSRRTRGALFRLLNGVPVKSGLKDNINFA